MGRNIMKKGIDSRLMIFFFLNMDFALPSFIPFRIDVFTYCDVILATHSSSVLLQGVLPFRGGRQGEMTLARSVIGKWDSVGHIDRDE